MGRLLAGLTAALVMGLAVLLSGSRLAAGPTPQQGPPAPADNGPVPAVSGRQSPPGLPPGLTGRTIVIPLHGATDEGAKADIAAGATIPMWNYTTTSSRDGLSYSGTMVGASPFTSPGTSTSVPTQIVPLIIHMLSDGGTFDPTAADPCAAAPLTNTSDLVLFQNSPIILSHAFTMNGASIGTTQYVDAFQRASFWSLVGGQNYHVQLSPVTTLSAVTVNVPAANGATVSLVPFGGCGNLGVVDNVWLKDYLEGTLIPSLAGQGVSSTSFPIFLVNAVQANPYVSASPLTNCCILGYHSAFGSPVQTYGISDFDTTGVFSNTADVSVAAHEVGEWMNDPLGTNPVPLWGHVGQQSGCQSNLEVGDPLSGTLAPNAIMPNGYTYHLQELAFFSWFLGSPSLAAGAKFSNNGTFVGQAHSPCPPGGTNAAPPTITMQPASQMIASGTTATMSVTASGTGGAFLYQWYVGASGVTTNPIGGATSSSFTTPALTTTTSYWVSVKDANGTAYSGTATITVTTMGPPTITSNPSSQSIAYGGTASLSVTASGSGLSYQWYHGSSGDTTNAIPAATSSSYMPTLISNTTYWVRASNASGHADSTTATVTVLFTDSPLVAGSTVITAVQLNQVRARIDAVRALYGGHPPFSYTHTIAPGSVIFAVDITEMQTALLQAFSFAGVSPLPFSTSPTIGGTVVVADINDLRTNVQALEK
jgi:hypothetical protein